MKITHLEKIPEICPLSAAQKGVYLECLQAPEGTFYNIPALFRFPKGIKEERLLCAIRKAISHHPVLDVTLGTPEGIPSMIYRPREHEITVKDVDDLDAECKSFVRPFDLANGPLARFELCRTSSGLCLLFDIHHTVFDGTSVGNFASDIALAYDGKELPEEELSVFDIASSEKTGYGEEEIREAKEYFSSIYEGTDLDLLPVPDVVADTGKELEGAVKVNTAGSLSTFEVENYIKENGLTENAFFHGAFAYALSAFSGNNECFFCSAHHGRNDKGLAHTYGLFVRLLPVYCTINENMSVKEFITAVGNSYYGAKHHSALSFADIAEQYGMSANVSFIYHGHLFDSVDMNGGKLEIVILEKPETETDIDVMVVKNADSYELQSHFRRKVYSDGFAESLIKTVIEVAREMLHKEKLSDIQFVGKEGKALLDSFNRSEYPYDDRETVVGMFRRQAKKTPDNICLVYEDKKYTYAQVDRITDVLAKHLVSCGVGREKVVGVLIPRCEFMLIASLGVLKAGAGYLPLDPTYPAERLNLMMNDSKAMMLICDRTLSEIITPEFTGRRLMTDEIPSLSDCGVPLCDPAPGDLFIMLYTSGSTGIPKGVMFEHANMAATTEWVIKYFGMDENTRLAEYASYGFDACTHDMYPTITSGGELHIISDAIRLDFPALRRYFNENGITQAVMTTQVGRQFALMGGLTTLRHLSVAGEKLTPLPPPKNFRMYNLYGPTEGTVVTSAFYIDREYKDVPIGKPVDNLKIYVVGKSGKLLPQGAVGELWISGPHVTRGYLDRPEKTAEAYGENPFDKIKGYERVYRTGDIVRILPDGNMQFVGRRDAQVKVRGFRVELTEVEEVIRRFKGIKDATVAAFDDPAGGKFIAAYVVSDEKVSVEELAAFIKSEKPPYMVPAVTMQIDSIPLNQNQKVNKKALPLPKREAGKITPPENETQKKILGIITDVLGHTQVGIDTDLYEAGLTSIGAVRLNVLLADAFDATIRVSDIKTNNTVRALESFLASSAPTKTYELLEDYPITENQSGVFIECMSNPGTTIYNIPVLMKLSDKVDTDRLAAAIEKAADAHPYIKTTLTTNEKGEVRAKRNDGAKIKAERIVCDTLPDQKELVRPFELLGGQLCRIELYETKNGKYLFADFHHIISDGTSEGIFFTDIDAAYAGNEPIKETFTGFEIALAEGETKSSARYLEAKEYWKGVLSGCETGCLPKKEPENEEGGVGSVSAVGRVSLEKIKEFCARLKITPNAFANSVFAFVLGNFAHKENLTYSTIYNGRSDSRVARSVMMLARSLPMTAAFEKDCAIEEYVRKMQDQLIGGMSNDACSFAELNSDYGVTADLILVYQGDDFNFDSMAGEKAEILPLSLDAAKAPVSLSVFEKNGKYEYTLEYRPDMFNASFAEYFIEAYDAAAISFLEKEKLSEVSMMSQKGRELYKKLNDSAVKIERRSCPEIIARRAKETPDAVAVIAAGKSLTYKELNEKANIASHALIKLGVKRETIVGVMLERTCDVLVCELAVMKAGGAFLPMLPNYPDERIDFCLDNADAPYIITTEVIKKERAGLFTDEKNYKALSVEELTVGSEKDDPNIEILLSQLAYCIYTSGSTGTPKGVMIEHGNFSNGIQTNALPIDFFNGGKKGRTAMSVSSISFDMSIYEMYLPLVTGNCIYIAAEEEYHNPAVLIERMLEYRVEFMTCTPSFMNNIVGIPAFEPALRQLQSLVMGAEALPGQLYDTLKKISPTLQVLNGYGPTETSMCCSTKELHSGKGVTIGRPTGNASLYVVDKYGNLLPPYGIGEMLICGDCVGRGYVKLPEKTAASFVTFEGLPAYHSGDMVRLVGQAEIDFGGRIDNQVKLRGFRVELDEIEKVMQSYPGIRQSKVIVRNNGTEDYLAAFFTATESVDLESLKAHLKSRLTYYMVPSAMMQLDAMPMTQNGKIDKKALPDVTVTKEKRAGRKAPKKSLEQRLCEIFAEVLAKEEIYADDNFFELGGTSLSASKVTMLLMSEGIEVKYGDIFDNPTPEDLAQFISARDAATKVQKSTENVNENATRDALRYNMVKYAKEVKRESLGNILLTGAVGFLGIHVLRELLSIEKGHIYCLVRKGSHENAVIRLKTMLIYYFSCGFEDELRDRITVLDADITDEGLEKTFADLPIDTVINCAACVKHFSDSDILERINVRGVENLIGICKKRKLRLVQISTVSAPGIHTKESYEKQIKMHENESFIIDDMDNKYILSKVAAEKRMFDAIEDGLRGKVIRVGNLMGRHSDGEFQANFETNMFLRGIKGFSIMGKYPISHMTDPMSFSPVDCTARAVVLLAGTNDMFTAFNCDNRYGFDEMKIIDACNRNGITILPEEDEIYYKEFKKKLGDERVNENLNGLAAYDIKDAHAVETDNLFTTNILYRIGFSWPLVDDTYLDRAINSILTLDYFDIGNDTDQEENE